LTELGLLNTRTLKHGIVIVAYTYRSNRWPLPPFCGR
jgi:hypothetical protein